MLSVWYVQSAAEHGPGPGHPPNDRSPHEPDRPPPSVFTADVHEARRTSLSIAPESQDTEVDRRRKGQRPRTLGRGRGLSVLKDEDGRPGEASQGT